jgi:hypothetical protein
MMGLPAGTRIWIAAGFTDMRSGFNGLAAKVEGVLTDDPFSGNVFVFRGRRGNAVKLLWSSGDGLCDCIHVKVRDAGAVRNKAVFLAIGVNMDGRKEVLGLRIAQTEGAKFWLQVLTELKNRDVQDIFIACVDGLKSSCSRNSRPSGTSSTCPSDNHGRQLGAHHPVR